MEEKKFLDVRLIICDTLCILHRADRSVFHGKINHFPLHKGEFFGIEEISKFFSLLKRGMFAFA